MTKNVSAYFKADSSLLDCMDIPLNSICESTIVGSNYSCMFSYCMVISPLADANAGIPLTFIHFILFGSLNKL